MIKKGVKLIMGLLLGGKVGPKTEFKSKKQKRKKDKGGVTNS